MTNQERAKRYLLDRGLGYRINEQLLDAMVTYGIECANAELERRRAAEAERDLALGYLEAATLARRAALAEHERSNLQIIGERDAALAQVAKLEAFKRAVLEEKHELR